MSKASDEAITFFKRLPEHEKQRALHIALQTLAKEVQALEKKLVETEKRLEKFSFLE